MDNELRRELIARSSISFEGLRKLNIAAGSLHFIQGIIMIALGLWLTWTQDLYTFYLKFTIISLRKSLLGNYNKKPGILREKKG